MGHMCDILTRVVGGVVFLFGPLHDLLLLLLLLLLVVRGLSKVL